MALFDIKLPWGNKKEEKNKSFIPPSDPDTDGSSQFYTSTDIPLPGFLAHSLNFQSNIKNVRELIEKYRDMSVQPEVREALIDILNDTIVSHESLDAGTDVVNINLDNIDMNDSIKEKIRDSFHHVIKLLKFKRNGQRIFHKWYVDGRLYYHKIIDKKNPNKGLLELRWIDPRYIQRVQEIKKKETNENNNIVETIEDINDYYLYEPKLPDNMVNSGQMISTSPYKQMKIDTSAICYVHSGMVDPKANIVLGHLQAAIKPLNQLRMIEDSLVIYRLTRAAERRIFNIYTGNLPKVKAEKYIREQMSRYKNKQVYDSSTGEIHNDRKHMNMIEDFWFPVSQDGSKSSIEQLPAGQNLGQLEDLLYFYRRLYQSLNVPISRLDPGEKFNLGRSDEITRDELRYFKFIQALQSQFSMLFIDLMKSDLSLKGVLSEDEWDTIVDDIVFIFEQDSHFQLLKKFEIFRLKLGVLSEAHAFTQTENGAYFTHKELDQFVLGLSDEEIEERDAQHLKEIKDKKVDVSPEHVPLPHENKFFRPDRR